MMVRVGGRRREKGEAGSQPRVTNLRCACSAFGGARDGLEACTRCPPATSSTRGLTIEFPRMPIIPQLVVAHGDVVCAFAAVIRRVRVDFCARRDAKDKGGEDQRPGQVHGDWMSRRNRWHKTV